MSEGFIDEKSEFTRHSIWKFYMYLSSKDFLFTLLSNTFHSWSWFPVIVCATNYHQTIFQKTYMWKCISYFNLWASVTSSDLNCMCCLISLQTVETLKKIEIIFFTWLSPIIRTRIFPLWNCAHKRTNSREHIVRLFRCSMKMYQKSK